MATITSTELQEATEAVEEQLSELLDETQAAAYWQERLDTATELVAELEKPKGKRNLSGRAGAAGRAEAAKRFASK